MSLVKYSLGLCTFPQQDLGCHPAWLQRGVGQLNMELLGPRGSEHLAATPARVGASATHRAECAARPTAPRPGPLGAWPSRSCSEPRVVVSSPARAQGCWNAVAGRGCPGRMSKGRWAARISASDSGRKPRKETSRSEGRERSDAQGSPASPDTAR